MKLITVFKSAYALELAPPFWREIFNERPPSNERPSSLKRALV